MKKAWLIVSTGFALFSMFFGSGNLVFPITVGQESGGHYVLTSLGILLTGVVVPFLGVFGMLLYRGDFKSFFSCFGEKGTFLFSFLALALMGPFGVLARCITVAHGALLMVFPNISLPMTSFLICTAIFFLAINKNKIVPMLGSLLTPFLLLSIGAIAYFGFSQGTLQESVDLNGFASFKNGFFQGYQTMDLLAAFFFSSFVIKHLYDTTVSDRLILKVFSLAALIGAGILALVYAALVMLGWLHVDALANTPPQEMLGVIAVKTLGSIAAPCVCFAVVFACITTAIILAYLFAEFLRQDVAQGKLGNAPALIITLCIGFFVSNLEFAGIAKLLGPILEATYPALIVLTLNNVLYKFWGYRFSHWPFTVTLLAKLCFI